MSTGEHDLDGAVEATDDTTDSMSEISRDELAGSVGGAVDLEEGSVPEDEAELPKRRLDLDVQITNTGPCKKHLKVAIARADIEHQFEESLATMRKEAAVPGFRPGRAPRQLVQKRFRKQVAEQVKSSLLLGCLEQIDKDYDLKPI